MADSKKIDAQKIDAYIKKHNRWSTQLKRLRDTICSCELDETVKWGAPAYTVEGKIIINIAAFKNHYVIWFHQGVFLADKHKVLINAQEGVTKGMRQWRFEEGDTIDVKLVKLYVNEAIENQRAGKVIKPKPKTMNMPIELDAALSADKKLKEAFNKLTPGRQKEYANHIGDAKQEKTRLSRVEKVTPMILAGSGLNDRYKNC